MGCGVVLRRGGGEAGEWNSVWVWYEFVGWEEGMVDVAIEG